MCFTYIVHVGFVKIISSWSGNTLTWNSMLADIFEQILECIKVRRTSSSQTICHTVFPDQAHHEGQAKHHAGSWVAHLPSLWLGSQDLQWHRQWIDQHSSTIESVRKPPNIMVAMSIETAVLLLSDNRRAMYYRCPSAYHVTKTGLCKVNGSTSLSTSSARKYINNSIVCLKSVNTSQKRMFNKNIIWREYSSTTTSQGKVTDITTIC